MRVVLADKSSGSSVMEDSTSAQEQDTQVHQELTVQSSSSFLTERETKLNSLCLRLAFCAVFLFFGPVSEVELLSAAAKSESSTTTLLPEHGEKGEGIYPRLRSS